MIHPARQPTALLKSLSGLQDPTRLRLLRLLERDELGVDDLCRILQLPQSTVSRHLKILAELGWLRSRAQGTHRHYHLAPTDDGPTRKLWQLTRAQTEGWATARQDQLRLARLRAERQPAALAFFAGAAKRWDRLRAELYGQACTESALLGLLPADWTVADLGCGTGQATARLAPYVQRVIAIDQSQAMLKAARKRTAGLPNVELRHGSLEALPLPDGSVDGALLLLALTYVSAPRRVVGELVRILRPGGRAVILDLMRHDREDFRREMGQQTLGFEPQELAESLGEAGLSAVSCHPIPPEAQARGPALLLATASRPAQTTAAHTVRQEGEKNPCTRPSRRPRARASKSSASPISS